MSRGLGRVETAIAHAVERAAEPNEALSLPGAVLVNSWGLLCDVYMDHSPSRQPLKFTPTPAQRKAVSRAMHSFARKHRRYALTGGQGRKRLFLYEPGDPLSAIWAKLQVASRKPVPLLVAMAHPRAAAGEGVTSGGRATE
jgi:hypothetical protein